MIKRSLIILALSPFGLLAQIPQELIKAERAKMLEGVKSVSKPGAPGPVAIWGNLAFPILAGADREGVELAVAAAAAYGKGRVILFGHNQFLEGNAGGDHPKLMENCVRWAGNKEKPRVGVKGVRAAAFYEGRGFKVETLDGPLSEKLLNGCDVLVLNMQTVTDAAEGAALADFIKGGGGLIGGMTGWAFAQTSGGKDLATSHGVNQALMPAGIAITDMSAFDPLRAFEARTDLPRLMNASEAVTAIKKQGSGGAALTPEEVKQGANAIQVALAAQPPDRNNLQVAVMGALGGESKDSPVPTAQAPLTQAEHASARIRLGMETRVLRLTAGATVEAHPASDVFPGRAPADAPRVTQQVQVNPAVPGWTSTGLYAVAGVSINIALPAAQADKGYAVRIGCHTDTLYHLDKWQRAPDISKSVPLTAAEVKTSSAFGGLIYIEVPARAGEGESFPVTIQGGILAPLFVLGQDDDAKWNNELKKRPALWAEFVCDKVILSCPSEVAREVSNPTELMQFWKKVVEAQDEISNQATERKRPERIVTDVQISAGYMHSGYPIMVPTSAAAEMVTFGRLKFPGWGYYHELGHNHQRGDFTFDGTTEVTNNVLGMYVYEAVLGKDWLIGHPAISVEARKENLNKLKRAPDKWAQWKSDPFVALTTYIQLVQGFGWDSWRKYLHSFADPSFGPKPANDDAKRDQFLVRYSKIVNKNLAPFFESCGIPVSSAAKSEVAKLEAWMPKGT